MSSVHQLLTSSKLSPLDAEVLLAHVLSKDRTWLRAHAEDTVDARAARRFNALVARRKKHEPVAYLTGTKEFYGRAFSVNRSTLIPRPETELLVEHALAACGDVYWDVGTGSGAIAVTIACEQPRAVVLATDISTRAIALARGNAGRYDARVTFLKSNLLQPPAYRWLQTHATQHLVIMANLPYLPSSDKKILAKDVTNYEPSSALFSGKDGLVLIRRFAAQLSRHVADWGYNRVTLFFEFDPPQAAVLKTLFKKTFPRAEIIIHRDLAKRARLVELRLLNLHTQ